MGDSTVMSKRSTFNLSDLFRIVADAVPDNVALISGERCLRYRQLEERATRLALWLRAKGIGAGDTVGIHTYNSTEFVETYLAACKLKAVPFNINFRYTVDELRYLYANAELKALIYHTDLDSLNTGALSAAPGIRALMCFGGSDKPTINGAVLYEDALAAASGSLDDIDLSDDDIVLLYTGGTTGKPKGVMWPHKALFYAALGGSLGLKGPVVSPEELAVRAKGGMSIKLMPTAPLIHGAGLWATLNSLLSGNTVVLDGQPSFNAERILDIVAADKVNVMTIVGDAMGFPLLDALKANPGRWDLSRLMALISSSALFSEHVQQGLKELLPPNIRMSNGMGGSETGQVGTTNDSAKEGLMSLARNDTVDVAVDGVRFARPGETGILVRMGHVPIGYFKDPKKTAETFVTIEGKHCSISGDSARLQADGTITIFGRDSQCINTGGEKVFVEEVEEALHSYDGIVDAVVVGLPDERWGQKVVAIIALRPGLTEDGEAIKAHARRNLAGYKVPKNIVIVPKVLRTPVGKADYSWAKATAEQQLQG